MIDLRDRLLLLYPDFPELRFSVSGDGIPCGKASHRMTRAGRCWKLKKTELAEELVAMEFRLAYPRHIPLAQAVVISWTAYFPIPPSWPKWKREAAAAGMIAHESKPDYENVAKLIGDAGSPVTKIKRYRRRWSGIWTDDAKVSSAHCYMLYTSARPRIEICIRRWWPGNLKGRK